MYESFYGLTGKPFQLNPDPSFFFDSKEHSRAMAYLEYGLHKNEGFIVITGEIGAGKTTVLRNLLGKIDPEQVVAVQLVSTQLNADDTLRMVGAAFGLRITDKSKSELLLSMEAFLIELSIQGKRALLIVDEAQNLTLQAMEELRMLSNYQLNNQALLQSFLVGQPEFRSVLDSPHMEQLRQRVIAACHIGPMDVDETRGYIEHRLRHVGWTGKPRLKSDAYKTIFSVSEGIPRRINSVCDRLLLAGYLARKDVFTSKDVNEAAREIHDETRGGWGDSSSPPLNGDAATDVSHALSQGLSDIDLSKVSLDSDTANNASRMIDRLQASDFEARLTRLERTNASAIAVLRHLLNAVRARHSRKKDEG